MSVSWGPETDVHKRVRDEAVKKSKGEEEPPPVEPWLLFSFASEARTYDFYCDEAEHQHEVCPDGLYRCFVGR